MSMDRFRRSSGYAAKIIRGAKPGDLRSSRQASSGWCSATARDKVVDRVLDVIPEGWTARLFDEQFKSLVDLAFDMVAGEVRELCETKRWSEKVGLPWHCTARGMCLLSSSRSSSTLHKFRLRAIGHHWRVPMRDRGHDRLFQRSVAKVTVVCIIGGRIVPSFTRNWVAHHEAGRLPVPFGRLDAFTVLVGAMAAWFVAPSGRSVAAALGLARLLHLARLVRWAGVPDVSRPRRPDPACCLCFRAARLPPGRAFVARPCRAGRGNPRLDRWCDRLDGDRCDDTRLARPHPSDVIGIHYDAGDLREVLAALAQICAALEPVSCPT